MADKPTDFNDQASMNNGAGIKQQVANELGALEQARQQVDAAEQVSKPDAQQSVPDAKDAPHVDNDQWRDLFEVNKDGSPKSSLRNIVLVFEHDPQWRGVIGYCDFSYRVMKRSKPPMPNSEPGEWDDSDNAMFRNWMSHQYDFTPGHGDIADALMVVGKAHRFHPVRDYLAGLQWDGEPRLDSWMKRALNAADDENYLAIVGSKFLIGSVARVMQPGCKMDNVMILEGEQGKGKSTIVGILFGEWFTDAQLPIGDKDAYQVIQGKWGFELAELDSFNKSETTTLKQFFSQQVDRFRPSYGRHAADFPRQTVFMGTTNQEAYLRDYTGNRRFWPAYCGKLDHAWVKTHRDQLWAEAAQRYNAGEQWWVSEDEKALVEDAQDARLQGDPWEDLLRAFLDPRASQALTAAEILEDCIGLDAAHQQQVHTNRLGPIMRSLGWRNKRERIPVGSGSTAKRVQRRVWKKLPDEQMQKEFDEVPI